jgi:hypothetical protein
MVRGILAGFSEVTCRSARWVVPGYPPGDPRGVSPGSLPGYPPGDSAEVSPGLLQAHPRGASGRRRVSQSHERIGGFRAICRFSADSAEGNCRSVCSRTADPSAVGLGVEPPDGLPDPWPSPPAIPWSAVLYERRDF